MNQFLPVGRALACVAFFACGQQALAQTTTPTATATPATPTPATTVEVQAKRFLALRDSLAKAEAVRRQVATSVDDAVKKALAEAADSKTDKTRQVATISLRGGSNPVYPVYKDANTPAFGKWVKLENMRFYLENGRLLQVYASGKLLTVTTTQQVGPTELMRLEARRMGKEAQKSRANAEKLKAATTLKLTQETRARFRADSAAGVALRAQTALGKTAKNTPARAAADKVYQGALKAAGELQLKATQASAAAATDKRAADEATASATTQEGAARLLAADTLVRDLLPGQASNGIVTTRTDTSAVRPNIYFVNGSTSIALNLAAQGRTVPVLYAENQANFGNLGLRYHDLVRLEPTAGRRLLAGDDEWSLQPATRSKPASDTHELLAGNSLGSLVEVALYTDLLATLDNEDNSLVTTEARSLLPITQRPLWANGSLFSAQFIRPFVTLSRLDSKYQTLRLGDNSQLDRPDLLQRAYLRFGADLNLLTLDARGHVTYQLNGAWTRTITRVTSTIGNADSTRNVYQNLYGLELLATVRRQRNFGCDIYFTAFLHNVQSRTYVANTDTEWALRPGALFYYHPFGSPSNKVFFRVSNYIFPESRQRDFVQLQFGYSIGLDSFLSPEKSSTGAGNSAL